MRITLYEPSIVGVHLIWVVVKIASCSSTSVWWSVTSVSEIKLQLDIHYTDYILELDKKQEQNKTYYLFIRLVEISVKLFLHSELLIAKFSRYKGIQSLQFCTRTSKFWVEADCSLLFKDFSFNCS